MYSSSSTLKIAVQKFSAWQALPLLPSFLHACPALVRYGACVLHIQLSFGAKDCSAREKSLLPHFSNAWPALVRYSTCAFHIQLLSNAKIGVQEDCAFDVGLSECCSACYQLRHSALDLHTQLFFSAKDCSATPRHPASVQRWQCGRLNPLHLDYR
jgi:hypothetical protein